MGARSHVRAGTSIYQSDGPWIVNLRPRRSSLSFGKSSTVINYLRTGWRSTRPAFRDSCGHCSLSRKILPPNFASRKIVHLRSCSLFEFSIARKTSCLAISIADSFRSRIPGAALYAIYYAAQCVIHGDAATYILGILVESTRPPTLHAAVYLPPSPTSGKVINYRLTHASEKVHELRTCD